MEKRGRNLRLLEDGFNEEYFAKMSVKSRARADVWTEKRRSLEERNALRAHYIYSLVAVIPVPIVLAIMWRIL